jgi:hypothetical protein
MHARRESQPVPERAPHGAAANGTTGCYNETSIAVGSVCDRVGRPRAAPSDGRKARSMSAKEGLSYASHH